LRILPRWLNWRYGPLRANGKREKVPISPRNGQRADATSPHSWGILDDALARFNLGDVDGIGIALNGDGLVAVDLDGCLTIEQLDPWAEEIVAVVMSYGEVSPSRTGIRLLARGGLPEGRRKRGPVEIYDRRRYVTITGQRLPGSPAKIEDRSAELAEVWRKYVSCEPAFPSSLRPLVPILGLDDSQVIRRATAARNGAKFIRLWDGDWSGYPSQSEGDLALCALLAFWVGPDLHRIDSLFRDSGLVREKWLRRADYRHRTITQAIKCLPAYLSPPSALPPLSEEEKNPNLCAKSAPYRSRQVGESGLTDELAATVSQAHPDAPGERRAVWRMRLRLLARLLS
jgi:primase-polymerase (primpol)-like protein